MPRLAPLAFREGAAPYAAAARGVATVVLEAASELVNRLRMDGDDRAELVLAQGGGYQADGVRHPHPWALVEPGDLVPWVLAHAAPD